MPKDGRIRFRNGEKSMTLRGGSILPNGPAEFGKMTRVGTTPVTRSCTAAPSFADLAGDHFRRDLGGLAVADTP